MVQTVIALCLFIGGQLVEHRMQPDISTCLKMKREATRNMNMNNKRFECGKVDAIVKKMIDGSISIDKIIKPK
jgi:hypothetical protein